MFLILLWLELENTFYGRRRNGSIFDILATAILMPLKCGSNTVVDGAAGRQQNSNIDNTEKKSQGGGGPGTEVEIEFETKTRWTQRKHHKLKGGGKGKGKGKGNSWDVVNHKYSVPQRQWGHCHMHFLEQVWTYITGISEATLLHLANATLIATRADIFRILDDSDRGKGEFFFWIIPELPGWGPKLAANL